MYSSIILGDCHDSAGHKDMCVTGAIYNYTKQLVSSYQDSNSRLKCKCYYAAGVALAHTTNNKLNNGAFLPLMSDNLTEALMFLSHFVGDVHQVCPS